ncbi:MAG: TIGR04282 family arsenosugar biosynthesis glycosyltransferase [Burkholderiales bacterium]
MVDSLTPVIVFAKAPVAGAVKTRLAPRLDPIASAALHVELVERTLVVATAAGIGPVELACAPDSTHPAFARWAEHFGVTVTEQGEGDLGAKMARALDRVIRVHGRAVLIGTDCPALDTAYLHQAAGALAGGAAVVLGPAEDGGYVLVGASRVGIPMFDDIEWGTVAVLGATRDRLAGVGITATELATLWDIDRPEDYERYQTLRREGK